MAEAFIQVLLDNLSSYIQGGLGLFFGFEKELERLSSTFSTIQAVLEDAQEKQVKGKAINNWLQKLNAAAYEVDDILDGYQTAAARFKQARLGRYHPNIVTFRYKVGKRMKEVMEKLDAIAEERLKFHLQETNADRQVVRRETGYILSESEVYGRDKERDEIVKVILSNMNDSQELSVLPIIGIGGLGKTTLAQMIYNDEKVTEHFNLKVWVCVSDDFDEKRLVKSIVESIEEEPLGDMDLAPLQKKLKKLLNGKKYLLVLDDVWNEDQEKWGNFRALLKVGARGASVLITSRLEKVGSIMGTLQPYKLSTLSPEDCWSLFMQRAFGQQRIENPKLAAIGKEIVKKCGGVPLASKTLGSLLRFKGEESAWKHVRDSEIWNLSQDETSILAALRLSYHHLPLDLRQCFAYCAVFPKDTKMEKGNLITLWMAHGFLLSKGNLDPEDVGNEVWEELYWRSFFQEIEKGEFGRTYFKMHDLIHDLASSVISTTTPSNQVRQVKVLNGNIMSIGFAEAVPSYSPLLLKKFPSLRVLDLSSSSIEKLPSSIGDLIHLRFLDLSNTSIRTLPKRLCNLQNLQTLDLSSTWIRSLPESLCNLLNLQILDLSNCQSLSCLPLQICKLSSLRIFRLTGCINLASMPPRIGSLTCLNTLHYFTVGERIGYRLGELRNLNQLRGSLTIKHLERVKDVNDAIEAKLYGKDLYSLSMIWYRSDGPEEYIDEKVLEALKPHPNLESLEIIGFRGFRFPDWMHGSLLQKIVSIRIDGCVKCSRLPLFGNLPCLESLSLKYGYMEYVEDGFHSDFPRRRFPSLRKLVIEYFPNLKGLMKREAEEQFPRLEEMEISECPLFVFPTLSSVKTLRVMRSCIDATRLTSISKLSNLTALYIIFNHSTLFPEKMFQGLANLETLYISNCINLKELPSSLGSLKAIKCSKITDCHALDCLPKQGLEGLTWLTWKVYVLFLVVIFFMSVYIQT